MKKTLVSLSLCALVALGATSCKKDIEQNKGGHQFRATMENCSSSDSKTTLSGSNINWNAGDEVMIYGKEQTGLYTAQPGSPATTATLVNVDMPAQGIPYTAIYPAALANSATSVSLPAEQVSVDGNLISNFPMYATTSDENLAFKNLFGALKLHLQQEGATVSRIEVTADVEINGNFDIDNSGENPEVTYADGGSYTTTLICTTPQDITNGHDFFVAMPAGTYSNLTIKIQNAGYGVEKHSPQGATITIERSRYFTLGFQALNMPVPPEEGIWGLFSVSATKQVYFSMGNLQYDGANDVWQFAAAQTEFLGAQNNNPTATSVVDLFGWGTSNYNGKAPYMTSTTGTDYGFGTNRNITATQYDWGVNNAIANGGNEANVWRTLTTQEWSYLLSGRTNATALRGIAKVDGVNGIVILPDMWTLPEGMTFNAGSSKTAGWNHNVYTAAEWAQMEAAGAAFLPCNGCRQGANFMLEETAHYWSVSSTSAEKAAAFYFRANDILPVYAEAKWHGHAIRLVQDAE